MACDKVPFEGGIMVICGGRRSRRRCAICRRDWATAQCDHPVLRNGRKGTCDLHICEQHRTPIGPNADLCPAHSAQYELNGMRFAMGDAELDPREPRAEELPDAIPTDPRGLYHVYKRGSGWLSAERTAAGCRDWIADRKAAQVFAGGRVLDATLKTHQLEAYRAERLLF